MFFTFLIQFWYQFESFHANKIRYFPKGTNGGRRITSLLVLRFYFKIRFRNLHCEKEFMGYAYFRSCIPTNGIEIPSSFPSRRRIYDLVSLYQLLVFEYQILITRNTGRNFSLIQYWKWFQSAFLCILLVQQTLRFGASCSVSQQF